LTVGSMGHSSSIALGIALQKPDKRIWIIDGDGAMLMHMGSLAVNASFKSRNIVHILINNESHETVGGQPTVASKINFIEIAKSCGYKNVFSCSSAQDLKETLELIGKKDGDLTFLEIKASIYSRNDLGRPTTTALDNKRGFQRKLK